MISMMDNENNNLENINNQIDEAYKRLLDSKRMSKEDIALLYQFGIISGLYTLCEILQTIEERGLKSAGKTYHSKFMEKIYLSLSVEYTFRLGHFYQNGFGLLIPIELQDAFLSLKMAFNQLELEMNFELHELDNSINQKEITYIFAAMANKNYFRSNSTLLAQSINIATGYSEDSIIRVLQTYNSTNGGLADHEKQNLLNKIKDAIDSF